MRPIAFFLILPLLQCATLFGQSPDTGSGDGGMQDQAGSGMPQTAPPTAAEPAFSRLAFGVGGSPLGIRLMTATNLGPYLNLRIEGAIFKYTRSNLTVSDVNVDAHLNLASAGMSLDIFPFPNHGLRFSPGLLFYNKNGVSGVFSVQGGSSFTLNNTTYYASSSNPVRGFGNLGLNTQNPAFTITGGWGNMVRRKGHFSFPFEIGVALTGQPSINIVLNSGQVCDAGEVHCVNVASDPRFQSDLQAQIAKYKNDLEPLKTYPIVSAGVAYSFRIR